MKKLFLIFLSLFSMTIQEIYIEKGNDGKCADINDNILHSLKAYGKMPTNFYDEYYGYNAQNLSWAQENIIDVIWVFILEIIKNGTIFAEKSI